MKSFIKSIFTFSLVAMAWAFVYAGSTASPAPALATDTDPTVSGWFLQDGQSITVEDFLTLTPRQIKESTGQKLSLKEKIALRYVQAQIKRDIRKGTTPVDATYNLDDETRKFSIGGFLLGLLLGLIGLLISLFFKNRNVRRSALLGFGVSLVISLIILAAG